MVAQPEETSGDISDEQDGAHYPARFSFTDHDKSA
jgi:hypothetical protein